MLSVASLTGRGVDALVRRAERTARSVTHAVRTGRASESLRGHGTQLRVTRRVALVPARCRGCGGVGVVAWDLQAATPLCSLHGPWDSLPAGEAAPRLPRRRRHRGCFKESADWIAGMARGLGRDGAVLPRPPPVGRNGTPHARCMHAPSIRQHSSPRVRYSAPCPLGSTGRSARQAPCRCPRAELLPSANRFTAHTGPVRQAQPGLRSADRVWTDADGQ